MQCSHLILHPPTPTYHSIMPRRNNVLIGRLFCTFVFLHSFMSARWPALTAPKRDNSLTSCVPFVITWPAKKCSLPRIRLSPVTNFLVSTCHQTESRLSRFSLWFACLVFFSPPTRFRVYQRKHLRSEG